MGFDGYETYAEVEGQVLLVIMKGIPLFIPLIKYE